MKSPLFIDRAAEVFGVHRSKFANGSKTHDAVRMRWACFYVLNKSKGVKAWSIGRVFGMDQSSVLNGLMRAEQLVETDDEFRNMVDSLELVA